MTTTDGWSKLSFASHVTRKTRSLGALVNIYTFHLYHTRKRPKKKSVTAGLYEDPDRLVVVKKRGCDWGACGRPRRRETGLSKQGCDWGACGRPRRRDLATSLALRVRPRRGQTRTRARPSRLRAIAGRKPRDETRSSGGEITERRL